MIEAVSTNKLFHQVLGNMPKETKMKVDWSFDIATAIDQALQSKGMSQKELAVRVGTSPASVHSWLGGTHNFTLSTLARISAVLDVPLISVVK
jgi:ribosome-binding protein aMBF1 (putative translation factor)